VALDSVNLATNGHVVSICTSGLSIALAANGHVCTETSVAGVFTELVTSLESWVVSVDDGDVATGVFSEDFDIEGWVWDKRLLEDRDLLNTYHNTFLGEHAVGLKDGTKRSFWQSGSILHTEFVRIASERVYDTMTWTPVLRAGKYSIHSVPTHLFSDYSFTAKFETDTNDLFSHTLRSDAVLDTIQVALFTRGSDFLRRPYHAFDYATELTGEFSGDERLATEDGSGFLPANFSARHREYVIRDGVLYAPSRWKVVVGNKDATFAATPAILDSVFENKDRGNPKGRDVFCNFFPIAEDSVSLYTLDDDGTLSELTLADNLWFSGPTDSHYSIDYDLGIITTGGYQAPDVHLAVDIQDFDNEIECLADFDVFASYPEQGIIQIGSEKVLYTSKGRLKFLDCVRGFQGTAAQGHAAFATVSDQQHGASIPLSSKIYIGYTAVPRIEYEVTTHDLRTANENSPLDVKPLSNVDTNNIIQISSVEPNLARIELAVDRDPIGGNIYGPIFFGTDTAKLTATAFDSAGNPVKGIDITIDKLSGGGNLNGFADSFTQEGNPKGQMCAFYNSPYSWDEIAKDVLSFDASGGQTTMVVEPMPPLIDPDTVTVYQVLKHDKTLGTQGLFVWATGTVGFNNVLWPDGSLRSGGEVTLSDVVIDKHVDRFKGGVAIIQMADGIKYRRTIQDIFEERNSPDKSVTGYTLGFETGVPSFTTSTVDYVQLIEEQAEEWDPAYLDGVRVVLYEYRVDVLHPVTGALGAYYPLRPDSLTTTTITFDSRELPEAAPYDEESNLGGYVVVTSNIAEFQARGTDPVSGRVVVSNKLRLRLDLPPYLDGVDRTGVLPIPQGFTFVTDESNVGAGIGGANFLTINPQAEGIHAFGLHLEAS